MLKAFIDDSWDGSRRVAVTAGCYIGNYSEWRKLREAWHKELKRADIEFFHSADYYGMWGEFKQFRDPVKYPKGKEVASRIRNRLFQIISTTLISGMAITMSLAVYEEVMATEPYAKEILPSKDHASRVVIQELFALCSQELARDWPGKKVAFIYNQSDEYPTVAEIFLRYKQSNLSDAKFMENIVPLDDRNHPQLQAADAMAHLAQERYIEWLNNPGPESLKSDLNERIKRLRVHTLAEVTRERLVAIIKQEQKWRGTTI